MRVFERKADTKNATLHLPQSDALEKYITAPVVKPSPDALISVVVSLPIGDVKLTFRKRNIMGNNTASQLSAQNFERAFMAALTPILGTVEKV